jgi:D-glycero-alpha-D-manno-heptose 1-phosphate guanylyltransferase
VRVSREKLQVLILAGGLGKRLRAAYADGPKSLAPVAGRPFLDYLMSWLQVSGFSNVVLCVGYRTEQIRERYQKGRDWGLRISYSEENEPLGTAGAIKNAEALIQGDAFLVLNGDSFTDFSLRQLVQFHRQKKGLATMVLAPAPEDSRYGSVHLNASGEILSFLEKQSRAVLDDKRGCSWINGGVYVFQKEMLGMIRRGRSASLEAEIFPQLVGQGFYGFPTNSYFIDIGVPADYRRAQEEFTKRFSQ